MATEEPGVRTNSSGEETCRPRPATTCTVRVVSGHPQPHPPLQHASQSVCSATSLSGSPPPGPLLLLTRCRLSWSCQRVPAGHLLGGSPPCTLDLPPPSQLSTLLGLLACSPASTSFPPPFIPFSAPLVTPSSGRQDGNSPARAAATAAAAGGGGDAGGACGYGSPASRGGPQLPHRTPPHLSLGRLPRGWRRRRAWQLSRAVPQLGLPVRHQLQEPRRRLSSRQHV